MKKKQSAFACFTRVGQPVDIFPAARVKGKLVAELRKDVAQGFEIIGIRYGTFQQKLDDEDNLLEMYPHISRPTRPSKYQQQEYTLLPLNQENQDCKWIYAEVDSNAEIEIPKFLIQIKPEQMSMLTRDFLSVAQEELDLENTPIMFSSNGNAFDMTKSVAELFEVAKVSTITYHCSIQENSISKLKKRQNIVEEIKNSEKVYIDQLSQIVNFWTPELKKRKLFTEFEMQMITNEFGSIQNCHKIFYDELEKLTRGYSTQVAGLFVSHASLFDVAVTYISSYPQINDIVVEKCESNATKKELFELAELMNGTDLLSFLITPVQRIPRYQLFLRDLLKCTPNSHPDSFLLKDAANAIEKMLRKIDIESRNNAQMWRLKQLEKVLLNNFKLYIPTRRFIYQTDILVKGHSDNHGSLYIFNDIILLTKEQSKGVTVLFDCPSDQFHYLMVPNNNLSIIISAVCKTYNQSIINPRKDYLVQFKDEKKYKEFFKSVVVNQKEITERLEYYLDWALMNTRILPPVCGNAAAANGSEFIFFGGQLSDKRIPSSHLSALNQFTMEYAEITAATAGRTGHTMTLIGSRLFIVGGRNQKKFFKKILCYDLKTNIWSKQLPNSKDSFEPRYGHTTTLCDNRLVIFGGRSPNGTVLNSITIFDPFDNMFHLLSNVKNLPPPRYHHSAIGYQNSLVVCAGKGQHKKLLDDIWEFNIEKQEWTEKTTRGEKLTPRKFHTQFLIGSTTIIVGGVLANGDSAKTIQISLDTYISKKVNDIGNVPYAIRNFASFIDRSGQLYIYGGCERKSKSPCAGFYMLKPKPEWMAKIKEVSGNTFDNMSISHLFNSIPNKKQQTLGRRIKSIVGTLFNDIDMGRSDVDNEPSESFSAPVKRSKSPKARRHARSARSSTTIPSDTAEKEIIIPEPTAVPTPSPEVIQEVTKEAPIDEKPQDVTPSVEQTPPTEEINDKLREEEEPNEPEVVIPLTEPIPSKPLVFDDDDDETQEQVLNDEISIFQSPAFQSVPKVIIDNKQIQESKKVVAPSHPLSEVLAQLSPQQLPAVTLRKIKIIGSTPQ